MKNPLIPWPSGPAVAVRHSPRFAALIASLIIVSLPVAVCRAQPASDDGGAEVLTRGPVHEAFAAVVSYNPEPGLIVKKAPPDLIEELPPEEKPEGDDVAWIPGYWGWDDERNDFLWISGTWRVLPPGREWMAGYWRDTGQGYQWISGYWADATAQETTYLPPPPATLEIGANLAAPSDDYGWTPGCWIWHEGRYAWRAGYWAEGRADWVWVPAYYVWTPRGDIFVEGFWDYPVEQRGILFAPVYYPSRGYARRGYVYSPRIVISLSFFADNLFLRPSYSHYYFGDYYDTRYEREGFYASFSYQSSRRGYDPFYSRDRWEHRSDRDWDNRTQASYRDRRDHPAARPPRTWAAELTLNARSGPSGPTRVRIAAPIEQLAARKDNPGRFQPVVAGDRQKLAQRGREVQQSRDERRTVEAKAVVTTGRKAGEAVEPAKVAVHPSPIMAQPAGQKGRNQAPPERPQAPGPGPKVPPQAEAPGRPPGADRRNSPVETRQAPPERNADVPREPKAQPAAESRAAAVKAEEDSSKKTRQDTEKRNQDQAAAEAQRKAQESQLKAQQEGERRAQNAEVKDQGTERAQQQAVERANTAAAQDRAESQRKAQEVQQQAEERAKGNQAGAREESQRKAQEAQPQAEERAKGNQPGARDESQQKPKAQEAPPRNPKETVNRPKPAAEQPSKAKPAEDDDDAKKERDKQREH